MDKSAQTSAEKRNVQKMHKSKTSARLKNALAMCMLLACFAVLYVMAKAYVFVVEWIFL